MIYKNKLAVEISIPKTGTVTRYVLINEMVNNFVNLGHVREEVSKSSNAGRLNAYNKHLYNFETHGHFTVRQYEDYVLENPHLKGYFIFSFIRNPYDRIISCWHWRANSKNCVHCGSDLSKSYDLGSIGKMKDCCKEHFISYWGTQTDYLIDKNGNINLDFIGKLENFEEDYNKMRMRHSLFPKFKNIVMNKSDQRVSSFSEKSLAKYDKDAIYELCKEDFENLGYEK